MSRAYLRIDPSLFERKVIEQHYPLPLFAAFVGVLCLAENQPHRGRFRDVRVLRALLGPGGRMVADLIQRGDLIARADGTVYVDGWDEWQEGDVTVGERVKRIRSRPRVTGHTVTGVTVPTVDRPLSGGGGGGGDYSPPPQVGRRKEGTNPRAVGTNPRANGTSPRQERERVKRDPTPIHEILRRAAAAADE